MTKIAINVDTEGGEPKVTTTSETANADTPKDIASLILFGKATYCKMIQNLIWATGYNVVAIPLAAGVLYKWGILLTPAVGAVFMSVSTIVVAINAKMLKVKSVTNKN